MAKAHRRGAKRIDRLGIVADDRQSLAIGFERNKDRSLQAVGVLVLIDQHAHVRQNTTARGLQAKIGETVI
jgi:hypothetical protein